MSATLGNVHYLSSDLLAFRCIDVVLSRDKDIGFCQIDAGHHCIGDEQDGHIFGQRPSTNPVVEALATDSIFTSMHRVAAGNGDALIQGQWTRNGGSAPIPSR